MARLVNSYFAARHRKSVHSPAHKRGNEQGGCPLGIDSRDQKLRDEIAPNTLLTINGDILDREAGLKLAEQYGVDGIMIGRGIFQNPFAFEKEPREHTTEEFLHLLRPHLDLHDQYSELEPRSFSPLARFSKYTFVDSAVQVS